MSDTTVFSLQLHPAERVVIRQLATFSGISDAEAVRRIIRSVGIETNILTPADVAAIPSAPKSGRPRKVIKLTYVC